MTKEITKEERDSLGRITKTKYGETCYKMYEICTCRQCIENV